MPDKNKYDFVIVGAGTAGCVLASRLTEDENARVLLLEAGSAEPLPSQDIPPIWPFLLQGPANWDVLTAEQAGLGHPVPLARGRGLGGSSAINGMGFTRGHRSVYDGWAADGAPGWGFEDLLPYFKRSENAPGRDPDLRGTDGPLTVGPVDPIPPVTAAMLDAAMETGYSRADDITSGVEEGFGPTDLNIVDGRRQSAADAYLRPVMNRPNLNVVTDALAHRVRIQNGRCTGVDYSTTAGPAFARCSQEVVLTAGAEQCLKPVDLPGRGVPSRTC